MEKIRNCQGKSGRVVGGLLLIAVGAALLLRNIGFFIPGWLFSWPMILILVGVYVGFKSNFRNHSWFIITAIGCYFLVSKYIPSLGLAPLFWPILIIGLGILFILRPSRSHWMNAKPGDEFTKWENVPDGSVQDPVKVASLDSGDYLVVESVFSGVNRKVVSKDFRGGHITSVFGGVEIDLSQADVNRTVIIKVDIVFGGSKLIIPPHWAVQNEINGVFHGVDDKRKYNPSAGFNPEKVLILRGSVVFGGIEIKSH